MGFRTSLVMRAAGSTTVWRWGLWPIDPVRSLARAGIKVTSQPPHKTMRRVHVSGLGTVGEIAGFDDCAIILPSGFEFSHCGCGHSASCVRRN